MKLKTGDVITIEFTECPENDKAQVSILRMSKSCVTVADIRSVNGLAIVLLDRYLDENNFTYRYMLQTRCMCANCSKPVKIFINEEQYKSTGKLI